MTKNCTARCSVVSVFCIWQKLHRVDILFGLVRHMARGVSWLTCMGCCGAPGGLCCNGFTVGGMLHSGGTFEEAICLMVQEFPWFRLLRTGQSVFQLRRGQKWHAGKVCDLFCRRNPSVWVGQVSVENHGWVRVEVTSGSRMLLTSVLEQNRPNRYAGPNWRIRLSSVTSRSKR